jgi:hypothetical protein
MMRHLSTLLAVVLTSLLVTESKSHDVFTNFIRQIQLPDELEWDVNVELVGSQQSELPINPNGARFELWTVKSSPLTSYLLDTTYVNSYIPVCTVTITTEDPYEVIPRTRIDRPFTVTMNVDGLSTDPAAPEAARTVKLLRHVQSYGTGKGNGIDRSQATLLSQGSLDSNGTHTIQIALSAIPGADRTRTRGEERFSVFTLADYQAPESQLDSLFVQVWPLTRVTVDGLSNGDVIKDLAPEVTVTLRDLYPDSFTYAQIYEGAPALGTEGTLIPGASVMIDSSVPKNRKLRIRQWDDVIRHDGTYTIEVLTSTPFGIDRLSYMSFDVKRTIKFNGNVTSIE